MSVTDAAVKGPVRRLLSADVGRYASSAIILFVLWYALSYQVTTDVVPTPHQTVRVLFKSLDDGYIWSDLRVSFIRISVSFLVSLSVGVAAGFALGRIRWIEEIFGSWVTVAATIPSLLVVVVVYLSVGLNDRAAVLGAAFIVAPIVIYNIWQGMKTLDPELSEMARVFNVPRRTAFRWVFLPQTYPFVFASARQGLALTWKIMIFVELVGRSSGVGYRINFWYRLFNMERALSAALLFVVIMLLVELVLVRRLERYLFRWRRAEAR